MNEPQWTDAPDGPGFYWWSSSGLISHRIVKVLGDPFLGWCNLHGAPTPYRVESQQGKWLKIAEPELPSSEVRRRCELCDNPLSELGECSTCFIGPEDIP